MAAHAQKETSPSGIFKLQLRFYPVITAVPTGVISRLLANDLLTLHCALLCTTWNVPRCRSFDRIFNAIAPAQTLNFHQTSLLLVLWAPVLIVRIFLRRRKGRKTKSCNKHKKTKTIPPTPRTMTTIGLISEAITALKDRTGSSVAAINKYLESEKKVRRRVRKLFHYSLTNPDGGTRFFRLGRAEPATWIGENSTNTCAGDLISVPSSSKIQQ
jgi:linker histone H1 and H5 family